MIYNKTGKNILFLQVFISCMFTWNGYAQYTIETVPNNKLINNSYISDPQQILDPETALRINDICRNVEDNAGAQMAIVILNAINSENPHDFGTRLFNYWGIGQAGIDNGLLILLVMNQRRVEFITGNGTEEILPDILCYDIQQKSMVPYFKDGNYSLGVANGVQECANILLKNEIFDPNKHNISTDNQQGASNIQRILIKFCLYVAFPLLCIYLLILIGVHLFVKDYYKKYYALRLFDIKFFLYLLPIPFLVIRWINRRVSSYYRNAPRFSTKTGVQMRRMSEHEDDQFLEKGMITEELVNSIDYDVWVGENQDDVLILAYKTPFSGFTKCPKCQYTTFKLIYSKTLVRPTYSSSGEGEKKKSCSHCDHTVVSTYSIARLQESSSSGGSSSGGSWGGGSSSGGGAGSSW